MKVWRILTLLLALGLPVAAQSPLPQTPSTVPSKEEIVQLLEAMKAKEMRVAIRQRMRLMTTEMMQKLLAGQPDLTQEDQAFFANMMDEILKHASQDDYQEETIPIYQKYFSRDDVRNLIAFYATPTGKKMLANAGAMSAEIMQAIQPKLLKDAEAVQKTIKERMDAYFKKRFPQPDETEEKK
jgi:uncharacterized protein